MFPKEYQGFLSGVIQNYWQPLFEEGDTIEYNKISAFKLPAGKYMTLLLLTADAFMWNLTFICSISDMPKDTAEIFLAKNEDYGYFKL